LLATVLSNHPISCPFSTVPIIILHKAPFPFPGPEELERVFTEENLPLISRKKIKNSKASLLGEKFKINCVQLGRDLEIIGNKIVEYII